MINFENPYFKHKKLYFSGEGTTYKFMGTVHGAYISGRDAANKIIKAIKN